MTKETMNVHKALIELNLLNDRISRQIRSAKFCVANRANNLKIDGMEIAEFEEQIKTTKQSIDDMMRRHTAIKRAIVASNATTEVEIAGYKYTVAEAIYMKNHGFDNELLMLDTMINQYNKATVTCNRQNDTVEQAAYDYVAAMYGGSDKNVKDHQDKVDEYIKNNSYELVDPLGVYAEYDERTAHYDAFMAEVDAALSTSNALTVIELEY